MLLAGATDNTPPDEDQLATKIVRLIEQLGHDNYILREQAQDELKRIGPPAVDALSEALSNDDVEVVMRARYLLSAIKIQWALDTDPARLQELLKDYAKRPGDERRMVMLRLAQIGGEPELDALCRMVRYEKSQVLSKRAALLIIGMKTPEDLWADRATRIARNLSGSSRSGAAWLRTFIRHRDDAQESVAQWKRLTESERELWRSASGQTNYEIVQALLFQLIDFLEAAGRQDETDPYMKQIVELQPNDEDSIKNLVRWLDNRNAVRMVVAISEKFPETFKDDPLLLYSLAHAQQELGNDEAAQTAVQQAQRLNPSVPQHHLVVAFQLQERGWLSWAEDEYRMVIGSAGLSNELGIRATLMLSEMLHDQERNKDAGDILRALVTVMKTSPTTLRLIRLMERDTGSISSRMHFFHSLHHKANNDTQKQTEELDKAVAADPRDADVLIALHRLPNSGPDRSKRTASLIDQAVQHYRVEIAKSPDSAMPYNQFAWLVGNTVGETDKDLGEEAIKCSHKSLVIRPDAAGYLDTLGRCYYARDDYENAVKYQREAAKLDPHSGLIRRQLELFEKALADSRDEQ
jgi:tetratricopeptide (TPR) repeat protein